MFTHTRTRIVVVCLAVITPLISHPTGVGANAPLTVGDGTPDSCTESAFSDALSVASAKDGGMIRFSCGEDPVTIVLTQVGGVLPPEDGGLLVMYDMPEHTTIDGGGLVTLAGQPQPPGPRTMFFVNSQATVTFQNLHLSTVGSVDDDGNELFPKVAAVQNDGNLTIRNCTFSHFRGVGTYGGAVGNSGSLAVSHSAFMDNWAGDGGAIFNSGVATVTDSTFSGNRGVTQSSIWNQGTFELTNSTVVGNYSSHGRPTIWNVTRTQPACMKVNNSVISGNSGAALGQTSECALTINNTQITDNFGSFFGGGIYMGGDVILRNSTITGNTGVAWPGGIWILGGTLTLIHTDVSGNTPSDF